MTEQAEKTPAWLLASRHIVGMMIVALAWRDIYFDAQPVKTWLVPWLGSLIITSVLFGLYALFFTRQAKKYWPKAFYTIAWILLLIIVAGSWLQLFNAAEAERSARLKKLEQSITTPKSNSEERWWESSPLVDSQDSPPSQQKTKPVDLFDKFGIEQKSK